MSIKRLFLNPKTAVAFLVIYLFAPGVNVYNWELALVGEAEAKKSHEEEHHHDDDDHHGHHHKHKHNKSHKHEHKHKHPQGKYYKHEHKHKHKGHSPHNHNSKRHHGHHHDHDHPGDFEGFKFRKDNFSATVDCSPDKIYKLQINYHPDFAATENADGPNILVVGSDESKCIVKIKKISGGKKCGFKVTTLDKKLKIDTINKANKKNCEMMIEVVAPRRIYIFG